LNEIDLGELEVVVKDNAVIVAVARPRVVTTTDVDGIEEGEGEIGEEAEGGEESSEGDDE
jgi:hypothetical protein